MCKHGQFAVSVYGPDMVVLFRGYFYTREAARREFEHQKTHRKHLHTVVMDKPGVHPGGVLDIA